MIPTANRRAVTLTEVLIAIFLMGIGLMAILSLFPLGASQMAQALQDQRAAEAATTAAGIARSIWKQACDADGNDAQMKFLTVDGNPQPQPQQPFILAMDDPNANVSSALKISSMRPIPRGRRRWRLHSGRAELPRAGGPDRLASLPERQRQPSIVDGIYDSRAADAVHSAAAALYASADDAGKFHGRLGAA